VPATQPSRKSRPLSKRCSGQGEGGQHAVRKGKVKRFRGMIGRQSDVKKAIVTLEEVSPST
jgi:hypothetical protein